MKPLIPAILLLNAVAAAQGISAICWTPEPRPCRITFSAVLDPEPIPIAVEPKPDPKPKPTGTVHRVGPNQTHATIQSVPWEQLKPGDIVEIYPRPDGAPYKDKWHIPASGSATAPIIVRGIRDAQGRRPAFDAVDAITRPFINRHGIGTDFNNESRGILRIGDVNAYARAEWITIEGLEFRGARVRVPFITTSGRPWTYDYNAAGIYIEHGAHITIRDCLLRDNGNGLFVASPGPAYRAPDGKLGVSEDILIEDNHITSNSYPGGGDQYHNIYTEALGITIRRNRFGPPAGSEGNNIKDRSANTVIEDNWIEGGNRQIDLVDSGHPLILASADYGRVRLANNVLIDLSGHDNDQIMHIGGDSRGAHPYRRGPVAITGNIFASPRPAAFAFFFSAPVEGNITDNRFLAPDTANWTALGPGAAAPTFGANIREPFSAQFALSPLMRSIRSKE